MQHQPQPGGNFGGQGGGGQQFFPQDGGDMFGGNGAMLQSVAVGAASQFSSRFVKGSLHKYEQFATLKYYFAVSTSYVRAKLLVLAFPFRHAQWRRAVSHGSGPDGSDVYGTPAEDVNGPDLYIPVMSFLTYILIVSFVMGDAFSFSPDVVAAQAWSSTLALFFEVLFVRLGAYLFASGSLSMLDLTCYAGYKYAHITVVTITGFIFGRLPFYAAFAYSSLVACLFALKTYRQALPNNAQGRMRQYFILAVSAVQLLIMWLLVHSPAEVAGVDTVVDEVDYDV
jgi:hypothetical protein